MKHRPDDSRLEREGARAAETGRSWEANPYLRRENMPVATGETLSEWSRKHDAWQRGFEGQDAESDPRQAAKERLPADLLAGLVEDRLRGVPRIRDELQRGPAVLRVALPQSQVRDEAGRNWNLEGFECGTLPPDECAVEFRSAVDELRDQFDLA